MTLETKNWRLETGRKPENGSSLGISSHQPPATSLKGYTLVELMVAVGLFALVMVLVSGAYLTMISMNRQVQGTVAGIDNLSFALETMTRTIRTGHTFGCGGVGPLDCASGADSFYFTNANGVTVSYDRDNSGPTIVQNVGGTTSDLTDPSSVTISSLKFYLSGSRPTSLGDYTQPHVIIVVSGTVSAGPGKTQYFTVETGAAMRGSDI